MIIFILCSYIVPNIVAELRLRRNIARFSASLLSFSRLYRSTFPNSLLLNLLGICNAPIELTQHTTKSRSNLALSHFTLHIYNFYPRALSFRISRMQLHPRLIIYLHIYTFDSAIIIYPLHIPETCSFTVLPV